MESSKGRILVVDDEKLARDRLVRMVGKLEGYEVSGEAAEGRTALAKVEELKPDIEGFPILASDEGRIFVEFQGYRDPYICHRLMAEVFLGCASEKYPGEVVACIVYTDKTYQDAALPLNEFSDMKNCHLGGCIREILLTDYTEAELLAIDPKLIVLAPFTLPKTTDKALVLEKSQEWGHKVGKVFPSRQYPEALDILGLFVLNRFRQLQYEEVIAMLHFDLMDTVAGQQVYDMGHQNGLLEEAREMIIEVLEERFGIVPNDMIKQIDTITIRANLKQLLRQAVRCSNLEGFKEMLLKAMPSSKSLNQDK